MASVSLGGEAPDTRTPARHVARPLTELAEPVPRRARPRRTDRTGDHARSPATPTSSVYTGGARSRSEHAGGLGRTAARVRGARPRVQVPRLRSTTEVVRRAPPPALGAGRFHRSRQPGAPVSSAPCALSRGRLAPGSRARRGGPLLPARRIRAHPRCLTTARPARRSTNAPVYTAVRGSGRVRAVAQLGSRVGLGDQRSRVQIPAARQQKVQVRGAIQRLRPRAAVSNRRSWCRNGAEKRGRARMPATVRLRFEGTIPQCVELQNELEELGSSRARVSTMPVYRTVHALSALPRRSSRPPLARRSA